MFSCGSSRREERERGERRRRRRNSNPLFAAFIRLFWLLPDHVFGSVIWFNSFIYLCMYLLACFELLLVVLLGVNRGREERGGEEEREK